MLVGARKSKKVEQETCDVIFAKVVLDRTLGRVYESQDYSLLSDAQSVFMAKFLEAQTSLERVYGEEFFQTHLDHF